MLGFKRLRSNQRGDTIVEVLISIAVISMILGGAYVTTNNSLRAERGAQERTDASKLVESQIEALKNLADTGDTTIFNTSGFCITGGTTVSTSVKTNNTCKFNATGSNNNTVQPVYYISITRNGNTFTVNNSWDSIETSGQTDSVQMVYKVYEND
ncbi:MAG TPA: prepilin-type N-terminal cleavage/methylation domain-containing protein [Candidatus Saccharimonadales bacterium]|nr:prepilin-type N-terminal cleavage/methylation domain-containing protein [Candidatus Saccharimonadales bacterium]